MHVQCQRPSAAWLWAKQEDGVLNFFRGGPMDGQAYETTVLLTPNAAALPLDAYRWSAEKIQSQVTGAFARVWLHDSIPMETPAPPPAAVAGENNYMARRKALKLSRDALAELAGTNSSQVWRLEKDMVLKPGTKEGVDRALAQLETELVPS